MLTAIQWVRKAAHPDNSWEEEEGFRGISQGYEGTSRVDVGTGEALMAPGFCWPPEGCGNSCRQKTTHEHPHHRSMHPPSPPPPASHTQNHQSWPWKTKPEMNIYITSNTQISRWPRTIKRLKTANTTKATHRKTQWQLWLRVQVIGHGALLPHALIL